MRRGMKDGRAGFVEIGDSDQSAKTTGSCGNVSR
jgi:hypothetical protein